MKKLTLVALALVLGVVLGVAGIGALLPAAHVASGEATLPASPLDVFRTIADVSRYPDWRSNVTRVELLSSDPVRWREHDGDEAITFELVDSRPPQQLTVRIADADLPFGGTWTYTLTPAGTGTRLQIREDGVVYNPVFRFVSRFVIGHTATIDSYLGDLRRRAR